jgi:hypothetical protein
MEIDNSYGDYEADFTYEIYTALESDRYERHWIETDNPKFKIVVLHYILGKSFFVGLIDAKLYDEDKTSEFVIGCMELVPIGDVGELKNAYEPHSYLDEDYRGQGLMKSIYVWILNSGITLLSCGTQTSHSNGLWKGIKKHNRQYQFGYIEHRNWTILKRPSRKRIFDYGVRSFLRLKNANTDVS